MLYSVLVSADVLIAAALIGLVLIQHGKGASIGAAFGSGASSTVFGSRGSASFLTRTTAVLAALFFINSITLAYLASNRPVAESVMEKVVVEESTGGSAQSDIDKIKEEISKQIDKVEEEQKNLPENVSASGDKVNQVDEQVEEKTESIDEVKQSLPDDVPQ